MHRIILLALLLGGCATEFRSPITGRIGGETAFGYATARLYGESDFTVDTTKGLRCEGKYDAITQAKVITATAACNDGRTGEVMIQRKPTGLGGTATGTFADGTKAQFVFGKDVRYEDEFPGPDATAPVKPAPVQKRR